jgi:hypothetical protein
MMSAEDLLPVRRILQVLGTVVVVGVVLCGVAALALHLRERQLRPGLHFPERDYPPPHRVAEIREQTFNQIPPESVEDGYAWVDREKRLVRIPIDEAMDLVAKGARPQ